MDGSNGGYGVVPDTMALLGSLREVIETEEFAKQRDRIVADIRRYDEVMTGITWSLSRGPRSRYDHVGRPVGGLQAVFKTAGAVPVTRSGSIPLAHAGVLVLRSCRISCI